MKKTIAILMAAVLTLSIAMGALSLSAYAATDDDQYREGAEDIEAPQLAPLNPDFVAYWDNPPETSFGYIPPPVDLRHLDQLPVEGLPTPYAFPSSYDWRDYGKVTPVKDQYPCGTCWAFGTTTVLESAVLIGESVEYDFSEQSVALCVDRSWVYLYDDWDDPCGLIPGHAGGWSWLASEVFIKKGSVLETCNPYNGLALQCDGSCVCDDCPPIKKVDGYRLATNDGSQIDVIKNAVYNQKPVTVAFQYDSAYEYWDTTWGAIYDNYPCDGHANHLISIVGWNDDVPTSNSPGDGAWIVKNSWGTADPWAGGAGVSDGYFYLAYDSSCAQEIAYLEYKDPVLGEELLYWDEAGKTGYTGYGDNDAWMASVFTADQASDLTHVDFWTTSNNAQYKIYVWNGFFGTELTHQTGNCQEYGYYSIPLSSPISIDAGQQFTVGVKMTTPIFNCPIPIEGEILGLVDPPIQTDVSFVRNGDGDSWQDLADYGLNACLRARMVSEVAEPDIWVNPPSFDVTLPPDTTWSDILEIGNDGGATLTYSISDIETTPMSKSKSKTTTEIITSSSTSPNTVEKSVESHACAIELKPSESMTFPESAIPNELIYDDGEADNAYAWFDPCSLYAVRFTPPSYPVDLDTARICIWEDWPDSDHEEFAVEVYDDDGSGGAPGTLVGTVNTMATGWGWHDVDISGLGITITDGDFYIAYHQLTGYPDCEGLCVDVDEPLYGRSWDRASGSWSLWPSENYMIRCVVDTMEDCPWLDENPKTGSVPGGNYDEITVSIDTTGLDPGDYSANIVISNNDPDENPKIVPVDLTVTPVGDTIVKVEPASQTVLPGHSFTVNVTVEDVTDMATDGAILHFDPTAMQATGITAGVIDTFPVEIIDNVTGTVTFAYALATGGFSGTGTLATIEFIADASAEGTFDLNLTDVVLLDPGLNPIQREVFNGTVTLIPFNITITSPENRTYASKCVRLNFTVEPEGTTLSWIGYSLDGGANVTIAGNTTVSGLINGSHSVVVYANDTNGNMAASNTVHFTLHPADIDGDCRVYVSDLLLLAQAYNSRPGDANWNPDADLDCSNRVYTADLLILAQNYNKVYPPPC